MKDLRHLSEITTRYGNRNINELEFSSPEEFKKYKAKHKMRPGTVVKVAGKDKVIGDEPKKSKRKSVQLDFTQAKNQAELERMVKKAGLDVKGVDVDINPNGDLTAKVTGDEETLRKFMTSDEYGMDEKDVDAYMDEYGEDAEDVEPGDEPKPYSAKDEIDDAIDQGDGDTAMELFQSEVGFKNMGKDGKEAKALLDRLSDYEYGLIDLDDKEQDNIKGRLKQLSNKHLGGDEPKDEPKAEPQSSNEAPVSGEPKVESSEMEDILMATLDDVGFGGQDTSGLEDIIYTYEDDLKEAGVLDDVEDDLYILQQIQSDDPSNPEDIPYEERERAVDRIRRKLEQADIIAESVKHSDLRELSKITTRYTNRLDEAGVPNHLRAGFKKLKNEEGLSIEERDELTDAYRKLVDLLTYGKFYENGKPNQRRKELSELTFDIQYALVGSKRLKPQNSQRKFESIWKKFTNMINTQIKIEEKGKQGNYIKAIRASKLDDVVDMFKRNTQRSTRKQKDLL